MQNMNSPKNDGTFPEKYPDYITLGYEFNPSPYANTVYEVSTGKMVVNTDSKSIESTFCL